MNRAAILAASIAGAVVVALDGTVLTVAQPTLQRDLGASYAQVQWSSTGYLVAVAALLVYAGRLGDRYGHRRAFAIGMLGFGAASAGVAAAPGMGWVILGRVVQGVFGALLQPATLGMLRTALPPDRLRGPLAARTAAIGMAAAGGPVVGGALATGFGWRAVFVVQVAPALAFGAYALAGREPERRHAGAAPDVRGALLLAAALACLVQALVTLPHSPGALSGRLAALGACLAGVTFVRRERRSADHPAVAPPARCTADPPTTPTPPAADPLVPPAPRGREPLVPRGVVGVPSVRAALGVLVAVSAALNGALFSCVYVLQRDLGLTPLRCALLSLPLAVLLIAAAPASAVLLRRAGARRTTAGAAAVLALGLLVLAVAPGPAAFCAGFALTGAGFGAVLVAATHVVVRQSPAASAGVAGALQQTAMNIGPVLGVAVATVLMDLGDTRAPLPVLALGAVAAVPLARALPGRPPARPAGRRDADHTEHAVETGSSSRSLRHDEV